MLFALNLLLTPVVCFLPGFCAGREEKDAVPPGTAEAAFDANMVTSETAACCQLYRELRGFFSPRKWKAHFLRERKLFVRRMKGTLLSI